MKIHHLMPSSSSLMLKPILFLLFLLYFNAHYETVTVEAAFIFRNDLANSKARRQPPTVTSSASRRTGSLPAVAAAAAAAAGGGDLGEGGEALFTQVISDVDDTIKSSGGVAVAGVALGGIDVQYARGDFYPGVFEFMLQISLGCGVSYSTTSSTSSTSTAISASSSPPKVAILTARAEEFKMALELKNNSKLAIAFQKAGTDAGITGWGLGPVLYGSVAEWIAQDRKGLRKFTNFERLLQQDPTGAILQYVYVGDTGELDQEAGETMLREYPELVKAVFLHCVSSEKQQQQRQHQNGGGGAVHYVNIVEIPPPKIINGRPMVFFRTYVGAAVAAVQLGFMTLHGLQNVIDAASQALAIVPRTSDKWIDMQRDIDRANALLEM